MLENTFSQWHKIISIAADKNWPCLPSPPDERDFPLSRIAKPVTFPPSVRLDSLVTRIRNQGG
jgi:hypothetical protein